MGKEVIISNSKLNCYGFRVVTSGIDITQFQRNPIMLWCHNRPWRGTKDEVMPIGRIENLRIEGDNLIGTPVFDSKDAFAKQIEGKFKSGFINMVSAGLEPIETSDDPLMLVQGQTRATLTKSKLLEVSMVDIGANDDALALYSKGEIIALVRGDKNTIVPEIALKQHLNIDKTKTDDTMKLIALKLGLPETANEEEVLAKITALQADVATTESLRKEVKAHKEKAVKDEIDTAIALKKIDESERVAYTELMNKDSENTKKILDKMKVVNPVLQDLGKPVIAEVELKWGFDDYHKSGKLEALKVESPERYKELFKNKFGKEPKI
jgi:hypothetical protein